jgi:hypothetical protein
LVEGVIDNSGMHEDVHIQEISSGDETPTTLNKTQPTADVKHFFIPALKVKGETKAYAQCISCQ